MEASERTVHRLGPSEASYVTEFCVRNVWIQPITYKCHFHVTAMLCVRIFEIEPELSKLHLFHTYSRPLLF